MLNFESEIKSTLLLFCLNELHAKDVIVDCCGLVCVFSMLPMYVTVLLHNK